MSYEAITLERAGQVAKITLNRPEKMNAINDAMMSNLKVALNEIHHDNETRVVVIKGAGHCFSAGQDLSGKGTAEVMPVPTRTRAFLSDMYETSMCNCLRWQSIFDFPR